MNDSPKSAEYPRLYQKKFTTIELKRGTHGIAGISVTDVIAARRAEKVYIVSNVPTAGTHPGVIHASDSPKSTGYPRLF